MKDTTFSDPSASLRQMADFFDRIKADPRLKQVSEKVKKEFPNPAANAKDAKKIAMRGKEILVELFREDIIKEYGPKIGKQVVRRILEETL